MSCVEAIAMGVSVVRTKIGGFEEMKSLCFGIDFGDVEKLSGLIVEFLRDDNVFRAAVQKASEKLTAFLQRIWQQNIINYIRMFYQNKLLKQDE